MPASSRPWSDVTRLVIDNGGHTCKVGFAGEDKPTKCMFNGLVKSKSEHKVFVGDEINSCNDFSSLQHRLSLERGCLVNWDTQAEVWSRAFGPDILGINPADCSLLVSECPMCPNAIQDTMDEMLFEHFGFHSYCSRPAPALAALAVAQQQAEESRRPAALVVDCGFSSTHTMPIFGGTPVNFATRRLNVGGKLLTNQLKTIVSYRSYNVMEENYLINDVKERLCYVSLDMQNELALTRFKGKKNTLRRDFVMPDYVNHFRGRIRDPNEPALQTATPPPPPRIRRRPAEEEGQRGQGQGRAGGADPQAGQRAHQRARASSTRRTSVSSRRAWPSASCSPPMPASPICARRSTRNIVLTGGSIQFPNFEERLRQELRALVPSDIEIDITRATDPIVAAWKGGSLFASSTNYPSQAVTREQYQEGGHHYCRRKLLAQSVFD